MESQPEDERQKRQHIFDIEKQVHQQRFDARREYAGYAVEENRFSQISLKEYGLQTLKWAFLANAGAIALILAFAGAVAAKADAQMTTKYLSLVGSVWPFALGCFVVLMGGAAAYFNFCYAELLRPTIEDLHNFVVNPDAKWPNPKGMRPKESIETFYKRLGKGMIWTRNIAVVSAFVSGLFFLLGLGVIWCAVN
jgi:hypothetical protein